MTYSRELEWRLAAAWAHYTWEQFCELDGEQMSAHIAAYRTQNQIDAVLAVDRNRRMASASGKR